MQENIIKSDEEFISFSHEPIFAKDREPIKDEVTIFETSALNKLSEQLHGFCQGQNPVAVLTGAMSSGKTTLLAWFKSQSDLPCRLAQGFTKLDLPSLFASQFSLLSQSDRELTADSLTQALNEAQQEFLLIIDNADLLSLESLQLLLNAFGTQSTGKGKLLLAGESMLLHRLKSLLERNSLEIELCMFSLVPLTQQETMRYLKRVVCPKLSNGKQLLMKTVFDRIYALSEGYMGRINRVASQLSSEDGRKKRQSSFADKILSVGIIVLLAVIGVRVWMLFSEKEMAELAIVATPIKTTPVPTRVYPPALFEEVNTPSFVASIENQPEELLSLDQDLELNLPLPEPRFSKVKHPHAARKSPLSVQRVTTKREKHVSAKNHSRPSR